MGLIANEGNAEWIAFAIVRARASGHTPIAAGPPTGDWREYAADLGAIVIEYDDAPVEHSPKDLLIEAARERGFPGIVVHDGRGDRIDLDYSIAKLLEGDSYAVEAVTGPVIETARVLAGIPAYNEASTIGDVVRDVSQYVDSVLVVDDGSDDRTVEEAREAGAVVVEHGRNRGYGGALKTIFEQAARTGVDHLVVLDADSQHDPADVPRLIETQRQEGADLVIGSRFVEGGTTDAPLYRRFGLIVVNSLTNIGAGAIRPRNWVNDTQSGFRAYSRDLIESLAADDTIADRMSASTDILNHAVSRGCSVVEVGTDVSYDVEEANTRHPLAHGLTLVHNLLLTFERRRPVSTLGVPGFASWLVGVWVSYQLLVRFSTTGDLNFTTGVVAAILMFVGLVACLGAVVCHALSLFDE
ncbi:glycosyltransferase family 2 protein [Halobaculum marinum]|uniref:Glycosyltransferase family 2 protein n=1 Tax=Halobaculum marinum TaxID=3031996 RepID=A0ABD5WY35_9EURY|nr:glycosyltransferase family 2 protein [Halobaculum sp. DT55]